MRWIRIISTLAILLSLSACVSGPSAKVVKEKPDASWMKDYPIPIRAGETLGDYKDWSFELWQTLLRVNEDQRAEREHYNAD